VAVARARSVFSDWSTAGFQARARALKRVRDEIVQARHELIDLVVSETGKARGDAVLEFVMLLDTMHYYLSRGATFIADKKVTPHLLKNKRASISYHPLGVVGVISPWNFPVDLGFGEAVPAMLAGNPVILKPSEFTPLISLEIARLARQAGLDSRVFQVMTGLGETGAALVQQVDHITFTGSVKVGRMVAEAAAKRLIPCTLELGGNDAMIVLRDADIDRAAAGAVWGAFFNCGQMCMSVERVYVEEPVAQQFIDAVTAQTRALRQGPDGDFSVDVGSMTRLAQLDTVRAHIDDAVAQGAKIRTGGDTAPGLPDAYFQPTVLTEVDHCMEIMQEETFGPVLPIMRVRNAQEAVRLANESRYGLNASVWSKNLPAARQIAKQIESGNVCINDVVVSYSIPEIPFGGVKESGIGRRHGPQGMRKYTRSQSVAEDRLGLRREPFWYPYSPGVLGLAERAAGIFAGVRGLFRR